MLENTGILVAGLSGGADSVCLVAVLKEIIEKEQLDIRLLAVHVNHGIRGTEAERDEQFAKQLCRQLSVEYISRRVDVPSVAHQEKLSEEEAGRILRYRIFKEIATQQEKHTGRKVKIAVAHHQNDQAETVLMNLVRGSSLRGICGIRPVRDNIIRPLLCVSRAQIEEYLTLQGLSYVTDSTNEELVYTRNKIRRELIPYLEKNLNPNAVQKLTELADSVLQAEEYIEQQAAGLYEGGYFTAAGKSVKTVRKVVGKGAGFCTAGFTAVCYPAGNRSGSQWCKRYLQGTCRGSAGAS